MKRKWLLISAGAGILVVFLIGLGLNEQSAAETQLKAVRKRASALHLVLTATELDREFPKPPESEDAWPIYRRAILLVRPGSLGGPETESTLELEQGALDDLAMAAREWRRGAFQNPLAPEHHETLRAIQPIFALLAEAAAKPGMNVPRNRDKGLWANLPEFTELIRLTRLAVLDALVAAHAGDTERFFARMESVGGLVRHLGQVPNLTYANGAWSMGAGALDALQQLLALGKLPASVGPRCRALLKSLDPGIDPRRPFKGDVLVFVESIDLLGSREKIQRAELESRFAMRAIPKPEARFEAERRVLEGAIAMLERWPADSEDLVAMRRVLGKHDAEIVDALNDYSRQFRFLRGDDGNLDGPMGRTLSAYEMYLTRRRLVACMLELLQARTAGGEFPSQLPDLGKNAIDPYTGEPFVYRPRPGGFLLYSLGFNRKDNGGVDFRDNGRPVDIVIRFPGGGSSL